MLTCPLCQRRSPERSTRCDCGYEFATGALVPPSARHVAERAEALKRATRTVKISAAIGVGAITAMVTLAMLGALFNSIECTIAAFVVPIPGVLVAVGGVISGIIASRRDRTEVPSMHCNNPKSG